MYVPTAPAAPSAPIYTPIASNLAQSTGQATGVLLGQASAAYDIYQSKRTVDTMLGVQDLLAATFAFTPIGPFLAISSILKHLTVTLVDRARASAEVNRIERAIVNAKKRGKRARAQGYPEQYAQLRELQILGPLLAKYGVNKGMKALRANPFYLPLSARRGGYVGDPETGGRLTIEQLRARYAKGYQENLAAIVDRLPRYAAAGTLVPPALAQYRR